VASLDTSGPGPFSTFSSPASSASSTGGTTRPGSPSAGVDGISVVKEAGRIADLEKVLAVARPQGHRRGPHPVGHPRGTQHPQRTSPCRVFGHGVGGPQRHHRELVRAQAGLIERGHVFGSDTDTEVIAHLIEEMASLPLAEAVRRVMH
jgi:glutamine---fructose-6-phosphate transaminase (isomerizing)